MPRLPAEPATTIRSVSSPPVTGIRKLRGNGAEVCKRRARLEARGQRERYSERIRQKTKQRAAHGHPRAALEPDVLFCPSA